MLQVILDWVAYCPMTRTGDLPEVLSAVRIDELPLAIALTSHTEVGGCASLGDVIMYGNVWDMGITLVYTSL